MSNPPTTLGQYQVIREIARSNDIVYEAWDPLMNRRVAIKELSVPSGSTPQQIEDRVSRFRREAQAVGTLNHPNIMTVFSFASDGGRHYMAMEYLDGTTLRHEVDSKGFLSADQAVQIACDVLRGLEHAHNAGVIHRDIKPDNVQLTSSGIVKITDFGIARLTFQPNLTMDGQVFGTPSYMSPEQVVGKEIDARSDLFSVGVMLYEMLSGTKPFLGDNVVAIATAIANQHPQKPAQVDSALWRVIEKSIDKTPSMRYANAAAMREALEEAVLNAGKSVYDPGAGPGNLFGFDPYSQPQPSGQPFAPTPYAQAGYGGANQAPYNPTAYGQPYTAPYGGGANPMGASGQPGVPNYPQLNTTPYGSQPYASGVVPPPVISAPTYGAYNPYNGPLPGQYAPPPMNAPVYYPPPPRQPLLKPETQQFLTRLVLMLVVLATFFGVIVFAFVTIGNSVKNSGQRVPIGGGESAPKTAAASPDSGAAKPVDNADKVAAMRYAREAEERERDGDKRAAEAAWRQSVARNDQDPQVLFKMAGSIYDRAQKTEDPGIRSELLQEAAAAYERAAGLSTDANRLQVMAYAGRCYYEAAVMFNNLGRPKAEIRKMLYKAKDNSEPGSELSKMVEEALAQLEAR